MRPRRWIVGLAVAVVATGCATALSPSPCLGEVSDPAQPPVHHDPELESRFPDAVAGQPLEVQSVCANASDPGGINMSEAFLEEIGVSIDEVTYALTVPSIGDGLDVSITGFRYRGASEDTIRTALNDAMRDAGETMSREARAGKDVDVAMGPLSSGVFYVADDTLYLISGADEQVDELLESLP